MLGSDILEIAIGMFFVYFLLSTMCSAISEWVGALTASRARTLEAGIKSMLNDPSGSALANRILNHPLIRSLESPGLLSVPGLLSRIPKVPVALARLPILKQISMLPIPVTTVLERLFRRMGRPYYIPSDLFVTALLDELAPLSKNDPTRTFNDLWDKINAMHDAFKQHPKLSEQAKSSTTAVLLALASSAPNDLAAYRKNLENWFDQGMERVSGWYKRKSQISIFLIAAAVSFGLNVDTLNLFQYLSQDSAARQAIAASARDFVQSQPQTTDKDKPEPSSEQRIEQLNTKLRSLKIPIGWQLSDEIDLNWLRQSFTAEGVKTLAPVANATAADRFSSMRSLPRNSSEWFYKSMGLIVSTVALAMGAPFYFELLKRAVNIRMTGTPPDEAKRPTKPA